MRIRCLLFLLAPILLSGATPVHAALGIEPQRLLPAATQGAMDTVDAKLPITELGQAVPNYEPEERDYLIRTIAFEASGEPDEGKAAVALVILNRKRSGRWGDNIKDVVMHPWQFEPWMTRRKEMEKLSLDDPRYQSAARIADAVLTGQIPDPTAGATHFLNPTVVRQRRSGSLPSWARGEGQPIGRHTFYSLNEDSAGPARAALYMGALGDPLRFDTSSQPLTRADCGKAGMLWNEGANVCTESTFDRRVKPEFIPSSEGAGHHRRRRCARRPGRIYQERRITGRCAQARDYGSGEPCQGGGGRATDSRQAQDRQVRDAQQAERRCGEGLLQVEACRERRFTW